MDDYDVHAIRDDPDNIARWGKGEPTTSAARLRQVPREAWDLVRRFPPGCLVRGCSRARGCLAIVRGYCKILSTKTGADSLALRVTLDAWSLSDSAHSSDHDEFPDSVEYVGHYHGQTREWVASILVDA